MNKVSFLRDFFLENLYVHHQVRAVRDDGTIDIVYLEKHRDIYVFPTEEEIYHIPEGPPYHYKWTVLNSEEVQFNARGHHSFLF